jgi:uncharacterized protein YbbK (DUF523 family)
MRPRIGISRCLLGDPVRYDATHKYSEAVTALGAYVEWLLVCPEVEVGMGVPREPIQLVARADGVSSGIERVRLVGAHGGDDWTERMDRWTRGRIAELAASGISGFVLKARSPSCGPRNVLVHRAEGEKTATGRGLFAEALATAMPGLPMEDEDFLSAPVARAEFLRRVQTFSLGAADLETGR